MRIDVGQLLREPVGTQVDVKLDSGPQCLSGDVDVLTVKGTLNLWRTTEGIWVRGFLAVEVDQQCVRCLAPVVDKLDIELDECFQLPPIPASDEEQVFAIDADHRINLTPILRELVIVSTPMRVLCQADCKGICPTCGKNLNEGVCDCTVDDIDPRMAALKALLT